MLSSEVGLNSLPIQTFVTQLVSTHALAMIGKRFAMEDHTKVFPLD